MLKSGYYVKAFDKAKRRTSTFIYKNRSYAEAKARELRKNPNMGVSIYRVSRGG